MKNILYLTAGIVIILGIQACNRKVAKNYNKISFVDTTSMSFIKNAMEVNLAELQASGIAIINSDNQKVVNFAKQLIDDCTKAGNELKKIEIDKMAIVNDTCSSSHQILIDNISNKSKDNFDKCYMKMVVEDNEHTVKLFSGVTVKDEVAVKSFINNTLPVIKLHLDSARAILASLK